MSTEFSQRLDAIARSRRLSNRRIGDRLGMSHAAVGWWRKGRSEPRADVVARLAEVLGVSAEYLMTGHHPVPDGLPADEQSVLRAYRSARDAGLRSEDVIMIMGAAIERRASVPMAPRPGDSPAALGPQAPSSSSPRKSGSA